MPDRPLKRILILDDDPDLLGVTMLALSSLGGYAVEACTSPMEALERVRSFAPDLVLLDVMMPDTLEEFWKDHLLGRPSGARLAQVERAC